MLACSALGAGDAASSPSKYFVVKID